MKETFDITGMTCAACSARVGKAASQVAGVQEANVNLLKNSMELVYEGDASTLDEVVAEKPNGGEAKFHFNPRLLREALEAIDEDEFTFGFNGSGPGNAVVLKCTVPWLAVVMPLRIG